MRPAIELGKPLAYGGQIVPPPRRVQPTAGYEVGWSLWGRLLGVLGLPSWRCFRRAKGPGAAGLRRLHANARAEAISGCHELLRAAAGPNLWLCASL